MEEKEQGSLAVSNNNELFFQMHSIEPSVVVKEGQERAGYVMTKARRALIPLLVPMFEVFDNLSYRGQPVNEFAFYVMGKICIDRSYGEKAFSISCASIQGIIPTRYDFVITEIATRNSAR